jgi:hypothetical protein
MMPNDAQFVTAQGEVVCNLVASYCNDWDCVDVFGVNKISIIMIFANVPFTSGLGVTLTLILPMLGHSPPPFLYALAWALLPIPLSNVMHLTGMRG